MVYGRQGVASTIELCTNQWIMSCDWLCGGPVAYQGMKGAPNYTVVFEGSSYPAAGNSEHWKTTLKKTGNTTT